MTPGIAPPREGTQPTALPVRFPWPGGALNYGAA